MNPLEQITNAVGESVGALSRALQRPTAIAAKGPLYPWNMLDAALGNNLEKSVHDKVIMITGGSQGIGEATAKLIASAGGEVVLVARGREKLEAVAEDIRAAGGVAHVYPCDLSDLESIKAMADQVLEDLGAVDILINNAGRSIRRSLERSYDRMHDYERTMQLNYFAPVQLMLRLLPRMRERGFGQVINVSSIGVQARGPRFGAYIASKAALDTLCDAWQAETHNDNVRFTTVHMPLVRTSMISATTIYDRFPVLAVEDAANVLGKAIVQRPRRSSSAFGNMAAFADALSPQLMDMVRSAGFEMFDDSAAAKGEAGGVDKPIGTRERIFAEATRGQHW